jgi:CubicO group peptidase (beta-lactamase class C family)
MKPSFCQLLASAAALIFLLNPAPANADYKPGRIAAELQPFVSQNTLAGAVALVATKDKVLSLEAVGWADIDGRKVMKTDNTFWIASMSKAMTAAGLMILVDEGKVKLDDPVEKYLPEFAGQMLAEKGEDGRYELKNPAQPITVRQILCHTSGMPFKSTIEQPVLDIYTLRQRTISYAVTPLQTEPGSAYQYSNAGTNTAGMIIEIVSGMKYEDFMKERLLEPLGMKDTTFWPDEDQVARLAKSYRPNSTKDGLEETTITQLTYPLTNSKRQCMPAGGYFSTAMDVSKFCRMLLNKGTLNGKRVLSAAAVKEMTTVQSGEAKTKDQLADYGFGLKITTKEGGEDSLSVGSYGHGGAYATQMWVDPVRELVVILMVQHGGFPFDAGKKINPTVLKAGLE